MSMCLSCGRGHDSWRAYCTNCQQTQAITKHMDSMSSRPVLTSLPAHSPTGSYTFGNNSKWSFDGLGVLAFFVWFLYMLYTFFSHGQFSTWYFIVGAVTYFWALNDL